MIPFNWNLHIAGFKQYLTLEKSLSKNSIEAYERDIKVFRHFHEQHFPTVSPLQMQTKELEKYSAWLTEWGYSVLSQNRILSGLRAFYSYLLLEGFIDLNPADDLENGKTGRKLPVVLSLDEIDKMIGMIDRSKPGGERDVAMLETLYSCGLRVSELIGLRTLDVHEEEEYITVIGKGNKERLVPIGKRALKHIQIYRKQIRVHLPIKPESRDILFLNLRGSKLSRVSVFQLIKKLAHNAGISKNISPHTFRHSFATVLVENGADLRAVQEMLGHESITTTEIYTHLDRSYLAETLKNFHPYGKKIN